MDIVGKFWSFCHKLRHDGVDSSDYIEQLTYLLFLKMAYEKGLEVPQDYDWQSLLSKNNGELVRHLEKVFYYLRSQKGLLKLFFLFPLSKIQNVDILKEIISEINTQTWTNLDRNELSTHLKNGIGENDFKGNVKRIGNRFVKRFEVMQNLSSPSNGAKKLDELTVINFLIAFVRSVPQHRPIQHQV